MKEKLFRIFSILVPLGIFAKTVFRVCGRIEFWKHYDGGWPVESISLHSAVEIDIIVAAVQLLLFLIIRYILKRLLFQKR